MAADTQQAQMDHPRIDDLLLPERYVTGRLNPAERAEFESHLVECPTCLDRVEAAEALSAGMEASPALPAPAAPVRTSRVPFRWARRSGWALAGACAAGLLTVLWADAARSRMRDELGSERRKLGDAQAEVALARAQLEQERSARQQAEATNEAQHRPPVHVPVLALLATRGADSPTLELPETAQPIVLSVEREEPPRFSGYILSVYSEAGALVWQGRGEPSSRDAVVVALDSGHFGPGRYILNLEGEGASGRVVPVRRYPFRTVSAPRH